ncbi:hypothetical protein MNBD_BACTEROID03-1771 [hydrothermal vent metagenome]|uniref:PKD domain-containing protein n=1 Tax=hydrothermal vent metagenome TaxID=652676 RepID=A0A3B0SVZ2_9ZZZZ
MKRIVSLIAGIILISITSCEPQLDDIGEIGAPPTNGDITVDDSDPFNPIFKASSDDGFIYHWDFGNNQTGEGQIVSPYFPFAKDYDVTCIISGAGGKNVLVTKTYSVAVNDPEVANLPVWKELTGSGTGKTWVYNTDTETGSPDYCYQTGNQAALDQYADAWTPSSGSWGQCIQVTPDINGEMVFDLNDGVNYTYHQTAGDAGVKGSFILDATNMTITIVDPYILNYNIECTNPSTTSIGVFEIKLLTDTEMVLWQDQLDANGTGWGWSFKKKE